MTRLRRIGLIVALLFAYYALREPLNTIVRPWLALRLHNADQTEAVVRTLMLLCCLLPMLHPRIRRDVRFRPVNRTLAVLLLVPFPLMNVSFSQGLPVFQSSVEVTHLIWFAAIAPIYEELLFRGYALYRAEAHPRFAIVAASIVFALMHAPQLPGDLLIVFFLGIACGIVRVISGGIAWPIAFHMGLNFLDATVFPHHGPLGMVVYLVLAAISAGAVLCWHPKFRLCASR